MPLERCKQENSVTGLFVILEIFSSQGNIHTVIGRLLTFKYGRKGGGGGLRHGDCTCVAVEASLGKGKGVWGSGRRSLGSRWGHTQHNQSYLYCSLNYTAS